MLKKMMAIVLTTLMMFTFVTSAYAATTQEDDYVDINGYACYERDGSYWTEIDGIEYLVIDVSSYYSDMMSTRSVYSRNYARSTAGNNGIGTPGLWTNNQVVDLTGAGKSYTVKCNITNGDHCSPVFKVTPVLNDYRFKISTGLWWSNEYIVDIYYHIQDPINTWHSQPRKRLVFNLMVPYHLLITGTPSSITDGLAIRVSGSSSGQKQFDYTVTPM